MFYIKLIKLVLDGTLIKISLLITNRSEGGMIIKKFKLFVSFVETLMAVLRGTYYIVYYRLFFKNVKIQFPFMAYSSVVILGPGEVTIGKRCGVVKNVFKGLTIVTLSENSKVSIGNQCLLGGLTIRCYSSINIANKVMTAISLIQDVNIINERSLYGRNTNIENISSWNKPKAIKIDDNVWIGAQACVLGGSEIGANCVLAASSIIYDTSIKEYSLYTGFSKRALPIEKIISLRS